MYGEVHYTIFLIMQVHANCNNIFAREPEELKEPREPEEPEELKEPREPKELTKPKNPCARC